MLVASLIAVIFGIAVVLRRNRGLYFTMGVLAIVCLMMAQLSYFTTSFTINPHLLDFHIGTLGVIGCCLFFLTANIGPMNQLADDKSKRMLKYRLVALLGPGICIAFFVFCLFAMKRNGDNTGLVSTIHTTFISLLPIYYSTKMAIIPDIKGGFVDCMRPYNNAVTFLMLLMTLESGLRYVWQGRTVLESSLTYAFYILVAICTLAVMFLLHWGAKKWKNI